VAGPSRLLGRAVEDGVFEGLRGVLAAGAGGGDIVVQGRVGVEVALRRSHLVEVARGKLVEAHKLMGRHGN